MDLGGDIFLANDNSCCSIFLYLFSLIFRLIAYLAAVAVTFAIAILGLVLTLLESIVCVFISNFRSGKNKIMVRFNDNGTIIFNDIEIGKNNRYTIDEDCVKMNKKSYVVHPLFNDRTNSVYTIPKYLLAASMTAEFMFNPLLTTVYCTPDFFKRKKKVVNSNITDR